jgi:hypothetical protein
MPVVTTTPDPVPAPPRPPGAGGAGAVEFLELLLGDATAIEYERPLVQARAAGADAAEIAELERICREAGADLVHSTDDPAEGDLLLAARRMALPALAALLLADLGLALLTRVAPQFNLFALGLPVKVLIGLGALAVALPAVLMRLTALFRALPGGMLGLAG